MRQVYLTSKENYLKINEKDADFPDKKGWHPNTIQGGTYKEKHLFWADPGWEDSLIKDLEKTEKVEVIRI